MPVAYMSKVLPLKMPVSCLLKKLPDLEYKYPEYLTEERLDMLQRRLRKPAQCKS